jgi:hypothetical protein
LIGIGGVNGALSRFHATANQGFGECAASGRAASTAITMRQEFFHLIYTGVFENIKAAVGDHQNNRQSHTKETHEYRGSGKLCCRLIHGDLPYWYKK